VLLWRGGRHQRGCVKTLVVGPIWNTVSRVKGTAGVMLVAATASPYEKK
jgi:hypothetical protein